MLLWTQKKGPAIARDLGPDPIGQIQPQDRDGDQGCSEKLLLETARWFSAMPIKRHHLRRLLKAEGQEQAPHPELREGGGAGQDPVGGGALLIASCASCGRTGAPTPEGFKHGSPKSARTRPQAFRQLAAPCKRRARAALAGCFAAGRSAGRSGSRGCGRAGGFRGRQRFLWTPRRPCAGWTPGPGVRTRASCLPHAGAGWQCGERHALCSSGTGPGCPTCPRRQDRVPRGPGLENAPSALSSPAERKQQHVLAGDRVTGAGR